MESYKCTGCGKIMETIPQCCSQDMIYNDDKDQLECYMGENCGYLSLSELKCEECCKKLN